MQGFVNSIHVGGKGYRGEDYYGIHRSIQRERTQTENEAYANYQHINDTYGWKINP
jgi:hypothetical protein